jgi:ABC-type phosphate transport system auxiliary subunit
MTPSLTLVPRNIDYFATNNNVDESNVNIKGSKFSVLLMQIIQVKGIDEKLFFIEVKIDICATR